MGASRHDARAPIRLHEPSNRPLRIRNSSPFLPVMKKEDNLIRGSWKLTRVAGIDLSVHWSFVLLLIWVLFSTLSASGPTQALSEVLFVVLLFGCVVLHELGHALAARLYGIPTHGITLLPIGGVAQLDRIPRNPFQELVIAVAGPAVNVVIAAVLIPVVATLYGIGQITPWALVGGGFVARLLLVNLVLVAFNLIPAFPMDGGRVLRAFLALGTDYSSATRWAVRIGQTMAVVLGVGGFLTLQNPLLLLMATFLVFAAESELRQALLAGTVAAGRLVPTTDANIVPARLVREMAPTERQIVIQNPSSGGRPACVVEWVVIPDRTPAQP